MPKKIISPDYIFETSWEVCNKVGGIYTVLSTKSPTLQQRLHDRLIFIGPDWGEKNHCDFIELPELFHDWREYAAANGLHVRTGRWKIEGEPVAVLVDFMPFFAQRDTIYGNMWNWFGVDSLHGYGDYHNSSMFGYAVGAVIESFYRFYQLENRRVIAHFHEWMTSFGLFYVTRFVPQIGTVFTTHATSIGRSIAGNHKPLYDCFSFYNGDQMAQELNMQSKHSTEKQAAHHAGCFTTVSNMTAHECTQLLEKTPDVITLNGFEESIVPHDNIFANRRQEARSCLLNVAEALLGYKLPANTLLTCTSGRYEMINKGINVVIDAMGELSALALNKQTVVTFLMIPANCLAPRADLQEMLAGKRKTPVFNFPVTHQIANPEHDPILSSIHYNQLNNSKKSDVKVIFVPCYLNGNDGIFNKSYYELLIGMDITLFPSYYEPWGYTPLESIAFSVPTITTDLSGFGQWASQSEQDIETGVAVVHRTDSNYQWVVTTIVNQLINFSKLNEAQTTETRNKAKTVSHKAAWKHFIKYYDSAYSIALASKERARNEK